MKCLPSGPLDAKIMFVGEAPGGEEEYKGEPLVGISGQFFTRCLSRAGLDRAQCRLDNVFQDRPPSNKFHDEWCRSKKEVSEEYTSLRDALVTACPHYEWPAKYNWSSVSSGKYVLPEHLPELQRLREEILRVRPNVIVALGGTALWALCGVSGITKQRGTVTTSTLVEGQKVLPTWHPAGVLRVFSRRFEMIADFAKAKEEMEFPEIRRPSRKIWIDPTLDDLAEFKRLYLDRSKIISFDTETARKQITCITFAPSNNLALAIPFVDYTKPGYNYWRSAKDEAQAWRFVTEVLAMPQPKLAQNGLYDLQYLWIAHGIPVRNFSEDTMLLHHALFLELPKDLGFLGSIYTNEASWKMMRVRPKDSVDKKDD